jgi:actin-related protein
MSEPSSLWVDSLPLQELVFQSLLRCDPDTRRELCANVVICGGGSLVDGLAPRLSHELGLLLPSSIKVKVIPQLPIERLHSAWIGGSILSICGAFQQLWVSKAAYAEAGAANIVRDKFDH